MKQVFSDFGENSAYESMPTVSKSLLPKISRRHHRKGVLGSMPLSYQNKSYIVLNRYDESILGHYGHTMGFFKIKLPKIKVNISKIVNSIGKVFQSVADMVKDTLEAAKKVVLSVTPPALHQYVGIVINPIPLITNPASTIKKLVDPKPLVKIITDPVAQVTYIVDPKPKIEAAKYAYKNVLKPVYRASMNVVDEVGIQPISKTLDATVYKVLPSHLTDKLKTITDLPEKAARGKLTADVLRDAVVAHLQLSMIPNTVANYFTNPVIQWARNDKLLGGVLATLDKYSGGLLQSAQNLSELGDKVYFDKEIDWKRTLIDFAKVYLAATGAAAFAKAMATNYVGDQTGLNKTPIGRDVLTAASIYASAGYSSGFTSQAAQDAGLAVLSNTAKREIIHEAAVRGIIDKGTLEDMVKYGQALYGTQNPDGTYNTSQMVSIAKDGVYQEFIREEVKRRTGLDLSLHDLADIYNYAVNPQELLDAVNAAIEKAESDLENLPENIEKTIDKAVDDFDKAMDNVDKAIEKAVDDYDNFDLAEFIEREMPRFEDNVKKELQRYADGQVDKFIQWALSQLGPNPKASDFTPELLQRYETTVLDLTGSPVPKKINPMVIGAGLAIMLGATYLVMED